MLPIPEMLIAIGFFEVMEKLKGNYKYPLVGLYALVTFFFAESYFANYITNYRTDYSWSWQYGYQQVVDYAKVNYSNYDKIIVTKKYGEPHEYFLFFLKYDPSKYQSDKSKIAFYQSNWWWVDHFDKYWFVNDWQVKDLITESKIKIDCGNIQCLLITSPNNYPKGWHKINTIKFLDGSTAFEMYVNK